MKKFALSLVLVAATLSASAAGATARGNDAPQNVHRLGRSSASGAREVCQADGAIMSTAMAAFVAQNPHVVPTMAGLLSHARGGPYLKSAPFNPAIYRFTIARGVLKLSGVQSIGPPTGYTLPLTYVGPSSCKVVRVLPGAIALQRGIEACEADGETVAVAMAAFAAENPHVAPTVAELVSHAKGGPYLEDAPYNPKYYQFSISHGVLKLATVTSEGPPIAYSAPFNYQGPDSCAI
jgi:hypothetical protein